MLHRSSGSLLALVSCVFLAACASQQREVDAPAEAGPPADAPAPDAAVDEPAAPERPQLTADECTAKGGSVVGDIGDGAIHRPEYRCESGAEPIGTIQSTEGAAVAVEGSVCCPQ